jgi:hypothetical protein
MAGKKVVEAACCSRCDGLWRVRRLSVDVVTIVNQWIDARAQQLATAVGVGAVLALNLGPMDLPIIGIILLIGIVNKSGIMLADFAIMAERERHMPPGYGDSRCLPAAVASNPYDNYRRLAGRRADDVRPRYRIGAAKAARLLHSGWSRAQPGSDAVHNPCGLSLPRPAQAWIQGRRALKAPQAADIPGIAAE